jgi:spermidine synthase
VEYSAVPRMLIGFGRRLPTTTGHWDLLLQAEDMNSSAAWSLWEGGTVYFHVSGKAEGSSATKANTCSRIGESMVYDDARHFVMTSPDKFDIITSDPIHPRVKGMASLYTTEYFEICKRHLNPGGFVTQWVPLYESSVGAVRSEIATFFEAFPNGTIQGNVNTDAEATIWCCSARRRSLQIDADGIERRLKRPDHAKMRESLRAAGYSSAIDLLSTHAAQATDHGPG